MKKYLIAALMLLSMNIGVLAQEIKREGNVFKAESSSKEKSDTLVTQFKYESKGIQYPIIVSKATGACYVWRISAKTGKGYRSYLKAEVAQQVCKELNIEYKSKQK